MYQMYDGDNIQLAVMDIKYTARCTKDCAWSTLLVSSVFVVSCLLQSSHYTTISDAVNKLNFAQALNDDGCYPFVCEVSTHDVIADMQM